ncbi:nucleotide-binding alpha-beta plait domain-containing protein [Artemisia annua]|uniref:Nucleotide-binding alpha-beta plait domain-containing protein n=1 Tax=Artemisia annua TaxID=35608 RepID=A0A2U1QC49_ARTAN|nr:nucleotide-binding alpha-beta plait domain-containing protein [Artemisia annua]
MGSFRTKEDDVAKISISIFVTNFPESFSAKDLFHACKQYGHVIDSFIPTKRAKDGKRFGFVRFINVFSIERLVNNLCTIWVGRMKLNANVARFNRENVKQISKVDNATKTFKSNSNVVNKADGYKVSGNTFANVVKGRSNFGDSDSSPSIVLDDECLNTKDLSCSLMGRVKELASLANLKKVLSNEGFEDIKISYLGELWVLIEFESSKVTDSFKENGGVKSWFSELKLATEEFTPEGRIAWIDVEGIPFKLWSVNTFNRIASKWGRILHIEEEKYYHSKRICVLTTLHQNILEKVKVVFNGKIYWLRAIEVPGWNPEFSDEEEEDDESDDKNHDEIHSDQEEVDDVDEVPDRVFEEPERQKDYNSEDPFGIYPLLNKDKLNEEEKIEEKDPSLQFPPGFTPEGSFKEQNIEEGPDKVVNREDEGDDHSFVHMEGDKENSNSVNMKVDSMDLYVFSATGGTKLPPPVILNQSMNFQFFVKLGLLFILDFRPFALVQRYNFTVVVVQNKVGRSYCCFRQDRTTTFDSLPILRTVTHVEPNLRVLGDEIGAEMGGFGVLK